MFFENQASKLLVNGVYLLKTCFRRDKHCKKLLHTKL